MKRKIIIIGIGVLLGLIFLATEADRLLKEDFFLKQFYHEKLWVHRVNSIERLQELNGKYNFVGIETDVEFDTEKGEFDINHPPVESIGLNLYDYLKAGRKECQKFWLDYKYLEENKAEISLKRLEFICDELSINREDILVESPQTDLLKMFENAGFKTAYYVHWPGLYTLSEEDLTRELEKVREKLKYKPTYISSPLHDYEILKKEFPEYEKLIWKFDSEMEFNSETAKYLFDLKVARDPKVKVLLYKVETEAESR